MSLSIAGRNLDLIGVIGSGQIGPDIALHFAKVIAQSGGRVVVVDVSEDALGRGKTKFEKKIARGEKSRAFKPDHAQAMRDGVLFTTDYEALRGAQLVVEAASENVALKGRIFGQVAALAADDAVLLSNSSHLEPERIFAETPNQGRTAVAHYFFPAERNPVVEIVPGAGTDAATTEWLMRLYEGIGKIPVEVQSRYGYACDPIFEGIFAVACLAVEAGLGTVKEVDFVAREALGMTVGPFTAMNLTGGNPITAHGLAEMTAKIQPWYQPPKMLTELLDAHGAAGKWEVCGRGESADIADPARKQQVLDTLRGGYLGLAFEILDAGLVSLEDLELALSVALDLTGPCAMANKLGVDKALTLVQAYADNHAGFAVPKALTEQAKLGKPFAPTNLVEEDLLLDNGGIVRLLR
ncbi:MAG: 3-hydroxyacyl-CoA dehydrogenase family protein, partial [Myxococcales bacterium]|nr:3-hydroxyacyl-CoA dehydrogenase family protein [Myxococcales bacterium]